MGFWLVLIGIYTGEASPDAPVQLASPMTRRRPRPSIALAARQTRSSTYGISAASSKSLTPQARRPSTSRQCRSSRDECPRRRELGCRQPSPDRHRGSFCPAPIRRAQEDKCTFTHLVVFLGQILLKDVAMELLSASLRTGVRIGELLSSVTMSPVIPPPDAILVAPHRSNRLSHRESHRRDRATIDGRLGRLLERTNGAGEANGPLFSIASRPCGS
jgi:hypothetical protein